MKTRINRLYLTGVVFVLCFLVLQLSQAAGVNVACTTTDLVSAINVANISSDSDALYLTPGCVYTFTAAADSDPDAGDSALPAISTPITIYGNGATITRSAAPPYFRLMRVSSTGNLTITNVTLSSGESTDITFGGSGGGAIYNSGTTTMSYSTLTGNKGYSGGAIFSGSDTILNISASNISGNSGSYGGAIYSYTNAIVNIANSTLSNNTALNSGGIMYVYQSVVTITGSSINGNSSDYAAGAIFTVNDGPLLKLTSSILTNNFTGSYGGAIHNSSPMLVIDSTFTGNYTTGNFSSGGAFYNESNGSADVVSSTFSGNYTPYHGGAIKNDGGTLNVTNGVLTGNKAAKGAGIYNGFSGTGAVTTVINSTLSGNNATDSSGGGGLYNSIDTTTSVTNSIIWGNSTFANGTGTITVNYSDVQINFAGTGNVSTDPMFVQAVDYLSAPTSSGNYRIETGSIAFGGGNNASLPVDTFDLDGDTNTTEALPYDRDHSDRVKSVVVDMGAYERDAMLPTATFEPGGPTPTFTPVFAPLSEELLTDGGFEIDAVAPLKQPDAWTLANKTFDKMKCNTDTVIVAFEGDCAYMFKGVVGEASNLTQKPDLTSMTFAVGDILSMSVQYKSNAPKLKVKVVITYTNTNLLPGKISGTINTAASTYTLHTLADYTLVDASISQIKVAFQNRATSGKIFIDSASLNLSAPR